jgi:DNA invertase Pin-like site-specific DNA recombinase
MEKAAIYCRLSKEDYDKTNFSDESESIINQRLLLTDYAIKQGYYITDVYVDDDYSGLYSDRPAFERLIRDARLHKFNVILAKTQSRFTRNMEHVEKYLHNDFPLLGIRFIGVIDGADTSIKSNKKARQINGLINEWYSEDLSENIRAVFREKMKKGQFLGSFACYGYQKDPLDNHKLIIDEEAAKVVRMIYNLYLQGYGIKLIADKLTDLRILTPTEYKHTQGLHFYNPNDDAFTNLYGIWSTTTIKRVLSNETYIGTLIQGREKKSSYKSKKVCLAPKNEWIVVPDNHEPIITKDIFEKTQRMLRQRRKGCKSKASHPHIFTGKIKCLDCHNTMVKTAGKSRGGYDYFICQLYRKTKRQECSRHSIRYVDLTEVIKEKLRDLITKTTYRHVDYIRQELNNPDVSNKLVHQTRYKLSTLQKEMNTLNEAVACLYIDKTKGMLNDNEYLSLSNTLQQKLILLTEEAGKIEAKLNRLYMPVENLSLDDRIWSYLNFEELTYALVDAFILEIEIGSSTDNQPIIQIRWRL